MDAGTRHDIKAVIEFQSDRGRIHPGDIEGNDRGSFLCIFFPVNDHARHIPNAVHKYFHQVVFLMLNFAYTFR